MTSRQTQDPVVAGWLETGQAVLVRVSEHAVERYRQRVRDLDIDQAREELSRLFALCPIKPGCPTWTPGRQRPLMHLEVAGTVMVALDPDPHDPGRLLARTVLTQGCFPRTRRSSGRDARTMAPAALTRRRRPQTAPGAAG